MFGRRIDLFRLFGFPQPCGTDNSVTPDADAMQALAVMRRTGQPRLMVVAGGRLVGLVTLKDLLRFFALKVELES